MSDINLALVLIEKGVIKVVSFFANNGLSSYYQNNLSIFCVFFFNYFCSKTQKYQSLAMEVLLNLSF
jgi:hypothetical protein